MRVSTRTYVSKRYVKDIEQVHAIRVGGSYMRKSVELSHEEQIACVTSIIATHGGAWVPRAKWRIWMQKYGTPPFFISKVWVFVWIAIQNEMAQVLCSVSFCFEMNETSLCPRAIIVKISI